MEGTTARARGARQARAGGGADSGDDLAVRLASALRVIWRHQGADDMLAIEESGLTLPQLRMLFALSDPATSGCSVRHLGEAVGLSLPSASRAVDALVRRRLVSRGEDVADRRAKRIALTAAGRRLVDRIASAKVAGLRRFIAGLDAAQRDALEGAADALLGSSGESRREEEAR